MSHSSSTKTGHCRTDVPKLKIGLVVDSTTASAGMFELAQWCQNQDTLTISHLLVADGAPDGKRDTLRSKGFTWLARLESFLLRSRNLHNAANQDFRDLIPEMIPVQPAATGCGNASAGSGAEWHDIKSLQLDILLFAGSSTLPNSICHGAKLGAIRICAGHGEPVGFWEVLLKQDYTGFSIRQLGDNPGHGIELISGQIATQYCHSLNRLHIEQKCCHYVKQILASIARSREMPEPGYSTPLGEIKYGMPGMLEQATYLLQLCFRQAYRAIRSIFRLDFKWSVAYQKRGWRDVDMANAVKIIRPDRHFLADPFVVSESGRDYCFLEDYSYSSAKGHIAVYELHGDSAEYLGNALVEPYHLSFPYMFRYKSELYMCPETSRNRQIRVYKCLVFPLQWQLHTVLMDDVSAADTMLLEHAGRWWMLTNLDVTETGDYCTELSIYWADSPLSSHWTAHSANPVLIDAAKGRNAGLLFDAGHIYRVAQKQGFERYGKAFSINRIDVLDENAYQETEVRTVPADFFPGIHGTHHMHSNGEATVFDFI